MRKIIPALVISWLTTTVLIAQSPAVYNYTTTDGLPSSECYDIVQDSRGFIWVATDRGVSCFDGYKFKSYTSNEGLVDNTVLNIHEDAKGRIWFLAISGNLCYFKDEKIYAYKYNEILTAKRKFIIRSFHCDEEDNLTLGTIGCGIIEISSTGVLKEDKRMGSISRVFLENRPNGLFYGLLGALPGSVPQDSIALIYSDDSSGFTKKTPRSMGSTNMTGLNRKNGDLVLRFQSTLYYRDKYGEVLAPEENEILRMYESPDSCLWVSYYTGGVHCYAPNEKIGSGKYKVYLGNEQVTSVLRDTEGGTWIATRSNGIYYLPSLSFHSFQVPPGFAITEIVPGLDDSSIYVGYSNGILDCYDYDGVRSTFNTNLNGQDSVNYIYGIKIYENMVVVSGGYCLSAIAEGKTRSLANHGYVRNIVEYKDELIGCSNYKIIAYEPKHNQSRVVAQLNIRTENMFIDATGKMWIGDYTGLYYLEDATLIKAFPGNELFTHRVTGIGTTTDGCMVVSTVGKGLVLLQGERLVQLSVADGLGSNVINCLFIDGNEIWLGTNKGISVVTVVNNQKVNIRNFSGENGLPGVEINNILKAGNTIWASTKQNLFYFDPELIPVNTTGPRIYIEDVMSSGKKAETGLFFFDQFPIRINFTGLSFKERGNVFYKYRLKGLGNLWQYTSSRYVEFYSLPSGDYEFEVAARNEDGLWSTTPAAYSFTIVPPMWQTGWFITLSALFIVLFISGLFYARIKFIHRKNKLASDILIYRQQALAGQVNPHFLDNALNSIQAFIMTDDKRSASKYLSNFSALMRKSLEHSRKEMVSLADEILLIRSYIMLEQLRFNNKFSFELLMDEEINEDHVFVPSMIIQPYIENAILHGMNESEKTGLKITLSFGRRQDALRVVVRDNGIGINRSLLNKREKATKKNSAGLGITTERLKVLCTSLKQPFYSCIVDVSERDPDDSGTLVEFNLPFQNRPYATQNDHN